MNKEDILTIQEFALQHVPTGFTTTPYRLSMQFGLSGKATDLIAKREEWAPEKQETATLAGQIAHQITLLTYEHPDCLHLPGKDDGTWNDADYANAQRRIDLALALQRDTETRLLTLMINLCDKLERPCPPWIDKLTVIADTRPNPPASVATQTSSKGTSRVYWRIVLEEHYDEMCKKYGQEPSIDQVMRYLSNELRDARITVTSGRGSLKWQSDTRAWTEVKKSTVSTFLSTLRRQRNA